MPTLGLKFRIVLALAVVLTGFILLTEISISELTRAMVTQMAATAENSAATPQIHADFEQRLISLRRLVFFYLVIGWDAACGLGSAGVDSSELKRVNGDPGACVGAP